MFLAKVVGNVVSTQKNEKLTGSKLLIVKKIDEDENIIGEPVVAIDTSIVGIVDEVEWNKH